jgi:broad specificity phosphatase PhoE
MAALPRMVLVRHGQTEWSVAGKHTGFTDLPLTPLGEANARALSARLGGYQFEAVFTSPLQRALRSCELAGYATGAIRDPDLREWNYGAYEGMRTAEIRAASPQWELFRDGCPHGESVAEISARADRVCARLRTYAGTVLIFSSSHLLRVLTARWLRLEASAGALWQLDTSSISVLGYEHNLEHPVIQSWNQVLPA